MALSNTTTATVSPTTGASLNAIDWIALVLLIVGGLNWGLVGAFEFDLVAALFGAGSPISRAVYILVGVAALYTAWMATQVRRR